MKQSRATIGRGERAVLYLAVGAAIVACLQTNGGSPAYAASCSSPGNWQVGFYSNFWQGSQPIPVEGASANLTDRGGYVLCTTDSNPNSNNVSSWTMVLANDGKGWAQSGAIYRFGYGNCVRRWAEQANNDSWLDYYINGCSNVGETHRYWQQIVFWGTTSGASAAISTPRSFTSRTSILLQPGRLLTMFSSPPRSITSRATFPERQPPGRTSTACRFSGTSTTLG